MWHSRLHLLAFEFQQFVTKECGVIASGAPVVHELNIQGQEVELFFFVDVHAPTVMSFARKESCGTHLTRTTVSADPYTKLLRHRRRG